MKSQLELPKQCNWELDSALIALDELKTSCLKLLAVPAVVRDFPEVTIVQAVTTTFLEDGLASVFQRLQRLPA